MCIFLIPTSRVAISTAACSNMGRALRLGWNSGPSTVARLGFGAKCWSLDSTWEVATSGKKNLAKLPLEKVNKIYISRCSAEFYIYDTMLLDVSAHCYDGTNDHRLEVLIFFRKKCEIFAKRFFFFAGNPTHNNALH